MIGAQQTAPRSLPHDQIKWLTSTTRRGHRRQAGPATGRKDATPTNRRPGHPEQPPPHPHRQQRNRHPGHRHHRANPPPRTPRTLPPADRRTTVAAPARRAISRPASRPDTSSLDFGTAVSILTGSLYAHSLRNQHIPEDWAEHTLRIIWPPPSQPGCLPAPARTARGLCSEPATGPPRPVPATPGRPGHSGLASGLDLSAVLFAPCSLGCHGPPRHYPAQRGIASPGLPYRPARHNMARHDAPLAQLAEQQTLNLRVRGSSPWRRTRADLVFLLILYPGQWPFPGYGCSTFARQSGPSRPGWPARPARPLPMVIRSVISSAKAQVEGSLLMRPRECAGAAVTPRPSVRYIRGPSEVHARSIRLMARPVGAERHRVDRPGTWRPVARFHSRAALPWRADV